MKKSKPISKDDIRARVQKLGTEWGDDPAKVIAQLRKIAKDYEGEISKKEVDAIWKDTKNKKLSVNDVTKWFKVEVNRLMKDPFEVGNSMDKYSKGEKSISLMEPKYIGKMFYYFYDPKTKKSLPYYDTFPLILCVKPLPDGFYGLNLHYLPIKMRDTLLRNLMITMSDTTLDKNTRLKIRYDMLSNVAKFRYFKPCFKKYLYSHVRSTIRPVPFLHWPKAILIPQIPFKKESMSTVWADSKRIARGK